MTDECIGATKKLAAHARGGGECPHEQKQGYHREVVIGHGAHGRVADVLERRGAADDEGKAAHPDQSHSHADRHAQQHQHE